MAGNRAPSISPGAVLLQALECEIFSKVSQERTPTAVWARAVLNEIQEANSNQALEAQAVMAAAVHAIGSIMRSDRWQYLLDDALRRPRVFGRTLRLMMSGPLAPPSPSNLH